MIFREYRKVLTINITKKQQDEEFKKAWTYFAKNWMASPCIPRMNCSPVETPKIRVHFTICSYNLSFNSKDEKKEDPNFTSMESWTHGSQSPFKLRATYIPSRGIWESSRAFDAIIPEANSCGKAPPSCTNLSQDPINTPCQEAKDPKSQLIWCCNSIVRLSVYDERGT